MNAPDLICSYCGRKNSYYRFWCEQCQASLPQPVPLELPDVLSRREEDRKQLYERVLADLDQLVRSHEVPAHTSDSIRAFYRIQLSQIERQKAQRVQDRSIDHVIRNAKTSARAGDYQQAVQALRSCAQQYPGAFPFDDMLDEVKGKVAQERAAQLYQEANTFFADSTEPPLLGQLQEVQQKLLQASELDPRNLGVRDALAKVNAKIAAEHSPLKTTPAPAGDQVENDIVIGEPAQPVEPADAQIEAQVGEPVDAERMAPAVVTPPIETPILTPILTVVPSSAESAVVHVTAFAPVIAEAPVAPDSHATSQSSAVQVGSAVRRSFAEEEEVPDPTHRLIDAASNWSTVFKPFLVDNVFWFVGTFLVIAGFVVLIVTFWGNIEQNRILMHSLVYFSLVAATGMFFALAYFMRLKYPQLENSSNVLLVIVTLLIPLVFAAAVLTTLVPGAPADVILQGSMG